jgi:methylmalonyl-CoA mutase
VSLTAAFDPIATLAVQGGLRRPYADITAEIADLCGEFERSGLAGTVVAADGRLWHAGGASEVQELAAALAAFVAWLRLFDARGIDLARAAARIGVVLAADADQFLTIAKFRAGRVLIGRIVEAANVSATVTIHAETAWRMMSRYDVLANIFRTTTAALAAGLGGADSVTVLPFDSAARLPDRLARRMARNSQTILMEEAGLAEVADPAAGSGAVEALTDRLAERAWDAFRAIESEGGLRAAVRAGTLQRAVAAMRESRRHRVMTRQLALTGINKFPAIISAIAPPPTPASPPTPMLAETVDAVVLSRLSEPFEKLRDQAGRLAARLGEIPAVFLVMMGPSGEYAALASEVRQIFASGGIAALTSGSRAAPETVGEAFLASGARAACICPAPSVDDTEIAKFLKALKEKSASPVGLAGQRVTAPRGIDFRVERGLNVVELLCNLLERIAAAADKSPTTQ